jgi:hypothetical protein
MLQRDATGVEFCSLLLLIHFHNAHHLKTKFVITMTSQHDSNEAPKTEQRDEKVVHDYHDYASEVEKPEENLGDLHHQHMEEHSQSSMNRSEQNFPVKLHYMLNELEKDGMGDIVSWQPHGRCFLVHKQQRFVQHVLPL